MSSRSLNKVTLIGNLTRDPELRYTPSGAAVCTIGLATNRSWVTESGERKEETEFHRVVAWNKLAELCSQLLVKGRKIYVEGRLRTNSWQANDGTQRNVTEVVIEDMIILDSRRVTGVSESDVPDAGATASSASSVTASPTPIVSSKPKTQPSDQKVSDSSSQQAASQSHDLPPVDEVVNPDDIPF